MPLTLVLLQEGLVGLHFLLVVLGSRFGRLGALSSETVRTQR